MRQSAKDFERVLEFLQGEDLGQNQRLPPERELAERLGLTRNRYGEASRSSQPKA
jgi:DNA-binding FadR family transcriptional regulator